MVKSWQAASVHGHQIASQTGCKLIAYTQIGMTHVISYLLMALAFYAYKVTVCFLPLKLLKIEHKLPESKYSCYLWNLNFCAKTNTNLF